MSDPAHDVLVVGVGCTRGTPCAALAAAIDAVLARHGLAPEAVHAIASIDTKRDEPALRQLARARGWSLAFHAAEALASVDVAETSHRVLQAVGAPAVAEPAALLSARSTTLRVPKTIVRDPATGHVITVAVASMRESA